MQSRHTVLAAFAVVLLLGACSSDSSKPTAAASSQPPSTVIDPPPPGLPAFYGIPNPLPAGKPGEIIKTEPVSVPGLHGTIQRVMYHSESIQGKDIPVTGVVAVPSTPPPEGGYPVISWAHGTTGIADTCAPSVSPDDYVALANGLLDAGYVVVGTDYEGLGTPGRHPYIAGPSEGRGTLDIVRAARNLPDVHASDRYLVWGHSQGGHAAMFALDMADKWAPELNLVGVVAGAPPSQLSLVYQALKGSPFKYYLLMAAAGLNAGFGDEAAPLDKVLTPAGLDAIPKVDEGCTDAISKATANLNTDELVKADPDTIPEWAKLLDENDPGLFPTPAKEPLLIIQGGNDEQIPVAATALMFDQLCKIHQVEQRWIYPGQSHAGVIGPSYADMVHWINDRFAGNPAPDPTPPTGQPDVQTQTCPSA